MAETKTKEKYELVEPANIISSKDNPRIINEKGPDFLELVESIRAQGVIVPIHIRNHPKDRGMYELLAGERRVRAAIIAGKNRIRAINHGLISDDEAFEITFAENFGREDLTALEQGKVVAILLAKYKGDTKAVAAKIGKSIKWVLQRHAIDRNLSKEWKKAVVEDEDFSQWTAAHLQLIAAFPSEIQENLLEEYGNTYEVPTVHDLEQDLAKRLMVLSKAPWDLNDVTLVKEAKACSKCQKRSSCQPGLFDDTTDAETVKKNDRCLDQGCWNKKAWAYLCLRAAELRKKYSNLVYAVMPDSNPTYTERQELIQKFGNIAVQWKASQEGGKDALPALIVYGSQTGTFRWIRLIASAVSGTRDKSRPVGKDGKPKPTPLKVRRALLEKKRWFVTIRNLIAEIEKSPVDKIVSGDHILTVMALAVTFGIAREPYSPNGQTQRSIRTGATWESFIKKMKTEGDQVLKMLWASVKKTICDDFTYCGAITQTPDKLIEDAKCAAKLIGIDINAMFKEVAKNTYPEPKSWKGLKADGTPKNAKATKVKAKKAKTKKNKPKKK